MGGAPPSHARTHAPPPLGSAEFWVLRVGAELGEGRRSRCRRRRRGREESPTVAAEGRRYGSHAGPNAAGRRAREPPAGRGGPGQGRVSVLAAPSAACFRPAPAAPRDRGPGGSGRRRGEGTRAPSPVMIPPAISSHPQAALAL
ncbi:transmembrane protein 250 isoform X1 [Camelus ferus]|uniref:Transmembrane protein 250 isoform X1 n=1 Tax=Camelus ferus TaxID=419612 RepID=A0A8B8SXU5_CAMFR|nr:transmembrane protein 250 isoform X1 [Camelus ferus]